MRGDVAVDGENGSGDAAERAPSTCRDTITTTTTTTQRTVEDNNEVGDYAKALKKTAVDGIKAMEALELEEMHRMTPHGLKAARVALGAVLGYINSSEKRIETLENEVKTLKTRDATGSQPIKSWAKVVGGEAPPAMRHTETNPPPPSLINNAKAKQMTVRINDANIRTQMAKATSSQLVTMFKNGGCSAAESIIAARRTARADVILLMESIEARKELEAANEWVKSVTPSAKILRQTFQVAVHGVCVDAVDTNCQEAAIEILKKDNCRLHPGLEIASVTWPSFAFRPDVYGRKKRYSTLVLEITNPEMANRLVAEGFLESENPLLCEKWERTGDPRQCYNCQEYGHMAAACTNKTKCGRCAGPHQSQDHGINKPGEVQCSVCPGKHESWSKNCEIRRKEIRRIQQRLENKSKWFNVPLSSSPTIAKDNEGFTVVPPRNIIKRKALAEMSSNTRKVGRPKLFAGPVSSNQSTIQIPSNQPTEFIQKASTQTVQSSEPIAMEVDENMTPILNE